MKRLLLLLATLATTAHAEVPEVRIARQFSMGYLQLNVIDHEKLIQKHAAELGIPEVKVTTYKFNGPAAMNDALLSDSIDVVSGSPQGLLTIWSRTRGSAGEVRAVSALATLPYVLNTNNPAIKTVDDLARCNKIAVPAVRVSAQAVSVEAAAAKAYGIKEFARYDQYVISMSPPDSTVALLSGSTEVSCNFAVPPYMQQQLQNPAIHTVLNSFDVWGGPNTFTTAYMSTKFRTKNPVLFKAIYAALKEATEKVNADPETAARYWIEDGESKLSLDFVKSVATAPGTTWTMAPQGTEAVAAFMHEIGSIKVKPASWKDYFFPEAYDLNGS
ncbi:MAG TPA: nitrate ABC transporter substrate-binding protein [Acetobacteraceae bacterium]|nr:nitrate ABC transporter substrate-binding protein [Acetobacteraceae bacterium]